MSSLTRRMLLTGIMAAMFCAIGPQVRSAQAQTGNWEYVEDLGGWLDWDTGLVWGEHSYQENHSSWTWTGAQTTYLPRYRTTTGIPDWRLPTIAELQTAVAHGIYAAVIEDPAVPALAGSKLWTSETDKIKGVKGAYAVNPVVGSVSFLPLASAISFVPVYRAFTP